MTRRAMRTDLTHAEVRDGLRGVGWLVLDLSPYGSPVDMAVCVGRDVYLVDAKTATNRAGDYTMTRRQEELVWLGWPIIFAVSAQDAVGQIQERRRGTNADGR